MIKTVRDYYELTKSGLVFGNVVTVIAGFLLASRCASISIELLFMTIVGMSLVMASGCVINNYIDVDIDKLMERTKDRVLVKRSITKKDALRFAYALGIAGFLALAVFTNITTVLLAGLGFIFYVFLYSMWWKRHSMYGAGIGAISGAMPPVVGYCAVTNSFDMGALILFMIMLTWQMPHFFAIAIRRESDYAAAQIPVMPITAGIKRTKISMFIYIVEFIIATSLLAIYGYAGYTYLIIVTILGVAWLGLSVRGFWISNSHANQVWARYMFLFSLAVMMITFITIGLSSFI